MTCDDSRRLRLSFKGSPKELRSFLAALCLLAEDDQYDWDLTASMARHPAGKRLGSFDDFRSGRADAVVCPAECHDLPDGVHHVSCAFPGSYVKWV